ncbi:hypothetical protein HAX54_014133 [Datura stramonium]|uniref:Uncharacterized protein n=1 Tax=Datura stramonium TaxID=4076 RepID=A0ABS8TPE3_DATST|nr:hypothetical protein [Datura stramonium]
MMEEDVIPSLKAILEAQNDILDLESSFNDNKLEGSFLKKGNPYSFWAFFSDGLTGPKVSLCPPMVLARALWKPFC